MPMGLFRNVKYDAIVACASIGAMVWEPDDIGLVAGVLGAIRTAAGALATSMYSSILSTELTKYLPRYVGPVAIEARLPQSSIPALLSGVSTSSFSTVPGIDDAIIAAVGAPIKQAYSRAFRTVFLCTIPFSVILLVAAVLYCPNVEDYMTEEVARKLQGVKPKSVAKTEEAAGVV